MFTSTSEDDYIRHLQPSAEETASLVSDLCHYDPYASSRMSINPESQRVLDALEKWICHKPAKDQWVFYIDTPRNATSNVAVAPSAKINMDTYYGGPNKRIFNPDLEPFRSIRAAGLQSLWTKAAAGRFAKDASGDVTVFFMKLGADLYDRAERSNDMATVFYESVEPVLKSCTSVRHIKMIANEDV